MFLFDWFRSLLPLHNPIGFGASDFIGLALAVLLMLAAAAYRKLEMPALRLAKHTGWCMLLAGVRGSRRGSRRRRRLVCWL